MARFLSARVAEAVQAFWAALQAGEFIADAAVRAGTYRKQGTRWVAACGGVRPRRGRDLRGRCLSLAEREEIALARARGETMRAIARRLGRSPSTISRELRRNADRGGGYRATTAQALAYERASRPKPAKPATDPRFASDRAGRSGGGAARPSRSPGGCVAGSPMTRRCGCRPRRSTSRCTCSPAARCGAS
jgi:DNA-binding CsgD family transcriptional regulator